MKYKAWASDVCIEEQITIDGAVGVAMASVSLPCVLIGRHCGDGIRAAASSAVLAQSGMSNGSTVGDAVGVAVGTAICAQLVVSTRSSVGTVVGVVAGSTVCAKMSRVINRL